MVIFETSVFTRQVLSLLSDEEYSKLQVVLANRPNAGALVKHGGGLRKIRWSIEGKGKRGGVRVIYYWAVKHERLLMLFIYAKNVQDDLTPAHLSFCARLSRKSIHERRIVQ